MDLANPVGTGSTSDIVPNFPEKGTSVTQLSAGMQEAIPRRFVGLSNSEIVHLVSPQTATKDGDI